MVRAGIKPDEFGRMSIGYYLLLCREWDKEDIRYHFPTAALRADLWNINTDPEKRQRMVTPWDFMPGWKLKDEQPSREATPEELSAFFGAVKNAG